MLTNLVLLLIGLFGLFCIVVFGVRWYFLQKERSLARILTENQEGEEEKEK